jgi:hypothetical protein
MNPTKQRPSKFPEEETSTGRQEVLTKVLVLISELSSESEKMFELLQTGGLTPDVRGKVTDHIFNINLIVQSIEEFLGVYHQVYSRDEGDSR